MRIQLLFAFLFASSSIMLAQMGGGMQGGGMHGDGMGSGNGNPNNSSGNYMQMFQSMGQTPMMGSGMGVGMTDDFAVGPDGTAYVVRSIESTGSTSGTPLSASWQFELTAISPIDGRANWKLPLSSGRVSRPVLASDGLIYLTVDNYQMLYANFSSGGPLKTPPQAQTNDGRILVISQSNGTASILRTIQTTSDILSAPRIAADPSGAYLVYVVGYDMMSWTSTSATPAGTFAPGEKTLYAYRPDGSLKFSVKLSKTGNGVGQP